MKIPQDRLFTKEHEWVSTQADGLVIGITEYAQEQLGDVVFVELPEAGTHLPQGATFGTVESVKAVSELYMPVAGKIIELNDALQTDPQHVNEDPFGKGWMIKVEPDDAQAVKTLLNAAQYEAYNTQA